MKELIKKAKEVMLIVGATLVFTLAVLVLIDIDHAELVVALMGVIALLIDGVLEFIYYQKGWRD